MKMPKKIEQSTHGKRNDSTRAKHATVVRSLRESYQSSGVKEPKGSKRPPLPKGQGRTVPTSNMLADTVRRDPPDQGKHRTSS